MLYSLGEGCVGCPCSSSDGNDDDDVDGIDCPG